MSILPISSYCYRYYFHIYIVSTTGRLIVMFSVVLNCVLVAFVLYHHEKFVHFGDYSWHNLIFQGSSVDGNGSFDHQGDKRVSRSLIRGAGSRNSRSAESNGGAVTKRSMTLSADNGLEMNLKWNIGDSNGNLHIPPYSADKKYKLIVDVGTELGSGYIALNYLYEDVVLLLFEGHPVNFGVTYHNLLRQEMFIRNGTNSIPEFKRADKSRILIIPTALSNGGTNTYIEFLESYKPGCGSILKPSKDAYWCAQTTRSIQVPVNRLDNYLRRVPSNYNFYLLKIDVEGADHLVLEGAGSYLAKFQMVIAECREAGHQRGEGSRPGSCNRETLGGIMKGIGFVHIECFHGDCFYAKTAAGLKQVKSLSTVREFGLPIYDAKERVLSLHVVPWAGVKTLDFE